MGPVTEDQGATDRELPAYGVAPPPPERPGARGSVAWLAAATTVVLVVVFAAATVARPAQGRSPTTSPSTTTPSISTPSSVPVPDLQVSPAAPNDGKAARRLPVRLSPDQDLVDGQVVGIHGRGFTPGAQVGIVICTDAAQTEGSAACDLSSYALSTADAHGEVQGLFTVRRYITVAGRQVDCRNGAIDPAAWAPLVDANGGRNPNYPYFTCGAVIGETDNYDHAGGWPIGMRGASFKSLGPSATTGANPSSSSTSPPVPPPATAAASTTAPPPLPPCLTEAPTPLPPTSTTAPSNTAGSTTPETLPPVSASPPVTTPTICDSTSARP